MGNKWFKKAKDKAEYGKTGNNLQQAKQSKKQSGPNGRAFFRI